MPFIFSPWRQLLATTSVSASVAQCHRAHKDSSVAISGPVPRENLLRGMLSGRRGSGHPFPLPFPFPRRWAPPLLRTAHRLRVFWLWLTRPLTMGSRAIVLDRSPSGGAHRVLLIRHSYIGGWHLPGGGVDRGETLEQAMRREVREEVGLTVEAPARLLGLYARFRHGANDHVGVFVVEDWAGAVAVDGFEILEADFFALDALPSDTSPATRRRLAECGGRDPVAAMW